MYIWSLKMEKFVLLTLKMKCLPKKFDRIVQIGDKNWSLVSQILHLVPKNGKQLYFLH